MRRLSHEVASLDRNSFGPARQIHVHSSTRVVNRNSVISIPHPFFHESFIGLNLSVRPPTIAIKRVSFEASIQGGLQPTELSQPSAKSRSFDPIPCISYSGRTAMIESSPVSPLAIANPTIRESASQSQPRWVVSITSATVFFCDPILIKAFACVGVFADGSSHIKQRWNVSYGYLAKHHRSEKAFNADRVYVTSNE